MVEDSAGNKLAEAAPAVDTGSSERGKRSFQDNLKEKLSSFLSSAGSHFHAILISAGVLVAAIALLWVLDKIFFFYATKSYVDELSKVLDLNKYLTRALLISSFVVAAFFGRQLLSISKKRRITGIVGLSALLVGHSLALWYGTRGAYFDPSGVASKCYVLTRDGRVTYGEAPGIDAATGRLCRPVTAEMLERLQQYEQGKRPTVVADRDPTFFDPRTGEPIVWYSQSSTGGIELFDLMGFHPQTGEDLIPITRQIVEQWKKQAADQRIARPVDPSTYVFFDPRNGAPRAWYWKGPDGKYEFFDSPGFHPTTGESLKVVAREDLESWKKSLVQRSTPKRIDPNYYAFFDPATGAPRVWYWRGEGGAYEFFDAPGFHPRTGDKLEQATRDIATKWKQDLEKPKGAEATSTTRTESAEGLERKARAFLFAYMEISGAENAKALGYAMQTFAPNVTYFGKQMSNREVLEDKRSFMLRWPERYYRLKPETIQISCSPSEGYCDLSAEFFFRALSLEKGIASSGVASNQIRVLLSGTEPQITVENGRVISRVSEDVRSEPQPNMYSGPGAPAAPQSVSPQQQQQMMNGVIGIMRQIAR